MIDDIPFEDLPTWMRYPRQNVDWGIIVVIFLSLLAAWPFFVQEGLPHTNATENYVYQTSNYVTAFTEGRLYPRWTDSALYGFGAPIPHYYPPGLPYNGALLHTLFTNNTVVAVRLLYILIFLMAGTMTYVFVMRWAGARAGILAAILYVYSPYFGMTAPHILGDMPGLLALALLPSLLWAIHRLLTAKGPFDFTLVSLISAALILTHVQSMLVSGFIAIGFIIVMKPNKKKLLQVALALLVGGALSSFYWMPAILEQNAIHWQLPNYAPMSSILTLENLISPLKRIDILEMVIPPQFSLGITTLIFAFLGFIRIIGKPQNRYLYLYFLSMGLLILLLTLLFLPEETWLLGPAMFCLAISGSAAFRLKDYLPERFQRLALPTILISSLLMAAPVWLAPRWPPVFGDTSTTSQILHEQQGFGFATLPPNAAIPSTTNQSLEADRSLISSYQTGNPLRIPQSGLEINGISSSSHDDVFFINTQETKTLPVLRANFPGWQAKLDGVPLSVNTDETTGLMQITIPPINNGELHIYLGSTPIRNATWWISGITAFILILMALRQIRNQGNQPPEYLILIDVKEARLLSVILAGFALIIYSFALPNSPYTLHNQPGHKLSQSIELRARTTVGLEALSYKLDSSKTYHIGDTIDFFIAWRTSLTLLDNYHVQVMLQDTSQYLTWGQTDSHMLGNFPTRRWTTGDYVIDNHNLTIPSTARSGTYQLVVIVYECNSLPCIRSNQLSFFGKNGEVLGQTLPLPTIITVAQ